MGKKGGPQTPEGKESSSKNGMGHGCTSDKFIYDSEAAKEVARMWEAVFPSLPEGLTRVRERLARVDFRLEWTERRVAEMETRLDGTPAEQWSEEQHHQLQLFYRYLTTADRQFHRNWNLLKQHAKDTEAAEARRQVRAQQASAQKEQPRKEESQTEKADDGPKKYPNVYDEVPLQQTVIVERIDGRTVTTKVPPNDKAMVSATGGTSEKRVIRAFEFPQGVPEEYFWLFPEPGRRKAGAGRKVEMSVGEWLRLAEKEAGNSNGQAEKCALTPTRLEAIDRELLELERER